MHTDPTAPEQLAPRGVRGLLACGTRQQQVLLAALGAALLAGLAARGANQWNRPLWIDEVFTGAIAITDRPATLVADCLTELSGPVYYLLMWLWAKFAGVSNLALRLPSLAFSVAGPAFLLWKAHPSLRVRIVCAATALVTLPLVRYSAEARSYAWLFMLGCFQIPVLVKLLVRPTLKPLVAWSGISALMVLTHYYTLLLVGCQGAALVLASRGRILRLWPALLLFVPVAVWGVLHLPFMAHYMRSGLAWQPRLALRMDTMYDFGQALLGVGKVSLLFLAAIAVVAARDMKLAVRGTERFEPGALIAGASVAAAVIAFGAGFFTQSYWPRYLLPFVPGLLLGVAVVAIRVERYTAWAPALVILLFTTFSVRDTLKTRHSPAQANTLGSWQPASEDFMQRGVRRVAFLWDHPLGTLTDPGLMTRVGSFFFDRSGYAVTFTKIDPGGQVGGRNANKELAAFLLDGARSEAPSRSGFIWIFPRTLPDGHIRTVGEPSPELSKQFDCRTYSDPSVLGCIK